MASPIKNGHRQNFSSMSSSLDSILAQAKETVARREGNTNQQHHDLLRQKDEELARLRSLLAERDRTSASASAAVVAAAGMPLPSPLSMAVLLQKPNTRCSILLLLLLFLLLFRNREQALAVSAVRSRRNRRRVCHRAPA
jgi:hypothetical protein